MDHAEQPIDPELIPLACQLVDCEPDHLLRATWAGGALTVVFAGYRGQAQTHVFTAADIAAAVAGSIDVALAVGLHQRPAPGWYEQHIAPHHAAAPLPSPAVGEGSGMGGEIEVVPELVLDEETIANLREEPEAESEDEPKTHRAATGKATPKHRGKRT